MNKFGKAILGVMTALCMATTANAANVPVTGDITVSTTWTANNVYNLVGQVSVMPGATLVIEAGTQIRSIPVDQGSLAITRGGKIYAMGTAEKPIVFTSTSDNGTNRLGVNEWGNITLLGKGLISASHTNNVVVTTIEPDGVTVRNNSLDPSGLNQKTIEGLTPQFVGDQRAYYGGNNDNDDSGVLQYISLRFGGKVIGLTNELNGLSLGGVGRETDIHHIDIFNNVDDGIEIWGGPVNLKYINIWNVGDDSVDIDQGYRGKMQFGLIVQGYGADAIQGSGVGDNAFEMDGAERADAQPVTTSTFYNMTVIGQPGGGTPSAGGDHGMAYRDNARVQFRNSIFMDLGAEVVRNDNTDGSPDNSGGYGLNGTLPFFHATNPDTWDTNAGVHSTINPCIGCNPGDFNHENTLYTVQTSGKLAEVTDSVFFNNPASAAYTTSTQVGVTLTPGISNPATNIVVAASSPIVSIVRGANVNLQGGTLIMQPVTTLDPRPANDALVAVAAPPVDGFFTPVTYRGAFSDDNVWICGWTAPAQFGLVTSCANPAAPEVTAQLVGTVLSFLSANGVSYSVEESTDGTNFAPFAVVVGNGAIKNVSDLAGFNPANIYRVDVL